MQEHSEANAHQTAKELAEWATKPDRFVAYYGFPAEEGGGLYRQSFRPRLHSNCGVIPQENVATVSTWSGAELGQITTAFVAGHNFGGRIVMIRVRGNNGAYYYGRASWDNGNVIRLRKVRG